MDWEKLDTVRQGVDMACKLTMPRSMPQHRWYWAMVHKVAEGFGRTDDDIHVQLKVKASLFDIHLVDGAPFTVMRSTSHTVMDGIEFTAYLEFAVMTVLTTYLPHIKRADLVREIDGMTNSEYKKIIHVKEKAQITHAQG
jgi:hypothetical protein